ncbi:6-bladed beta-propeller [Fodinibius halophilus]|uniref:6-bladed beta-propeller n=1 Tax=Fodinibius halophilus TaxID=1736908 RepID=A0A6M1SVM8_9BACT|nr:6-bladed beta-propeller [Fodinibius halophilus]NGP87636.1 6-bladed beta-propeller [Fodinibius halophilus]
MNIIENLRPNPLCIAFFLALFLVTSNNNAFSQYAKQNPSKAFKDLFVKNKEIFISIDENTLLDRPVSILQTKNDQLIWGEKEGIKVFDQSGALIKKVELSGRGPGELIRASQYNLTESNITILDASQLKVIVLNNDCEFQHEFLVAKNRTKLHAKSSKGNYYTLNELMLNSETPALSKYDSTGTKIAEWGIVPLTAKTQRANQNGGGITSDGRGNIYYSYQGDFRIWKLNTSENSISIFKNKPSYFKPISQKELQTTQRARKLFYLGYKGTRLTGLFFLKPNIILQQFETGNPFNKPKEELTYYLEIWNTSGEKLASKIEIPYPIAWVDQNSITLPTMYPSKILQQKGEIKAFKTFTIQISK